LSSLFTGRTVHGQEQHIFHQFTGNLEILCIDEIMVYIVMFALESWRDAAAYPLRLGCPHNENHPA
jgi:hypothetical protein